MMYDYENAATWFVEIVNKKPQETSTPGQWVYTICVRVVDAPSPSIAQELARLYAHGVGASAFTRCREVGDIRKSGLTKSMLEDGIDEYVERTTGKKRKK